MLSTRVALTMQGKKIPVKLVLIFLYHLKSVIHRKSKDGCRRKMDITQAIAESKSNFTKLEQRVATYLTSRPEAIALETSGEIAQKLGVSPMTVSRFFKKIGDQKVTTLRAEARKNLYGPTAARIGSRYENFTRSQQDRQSSADHDVALKGIDTALEWRDSELWQEAVRKTAHADSVLAIGFQIMQYLARGLCMRLKYVRENVFLVDGGDGIYAEVFNDNSEHKVLILIDTFRYGAHGPILAKAAKERGFDIILFCDEYCEWAQDVVDYTITFPNEGHFFMPFPTGIHFGLNLFYQDIIHELGDKARDQVEQLSNSQELFGSFIPE
jgi:DNA-binding MurR/RpiR family transcriptional regulator